MTRRPNRREFVLSASAAALAIVPARAQAPQTGPLTARRIVERIQANIGVPWRTETVDTFKAGNPDAVVRGVATTVMATLPVLERAAAAGRNFIVSHEPTFYSHTDVTTELEDDPVYRRKAALITQHDLVVWRFHDHWHLRRPEPMSFALAARLGWERFPATGASGVRMYAMNETTLAAAAKHVAGRLQVNAMRVMGDPATRITRVAFMPGYGQPAALMRALTDADLVISGEQREWEGLFYAHDAVAAGRAKAVIVLGHAVSEEPGMQLCADWVRTFVPEVPVELVPAGEPFWRPPAA
jgi:putative NIF3 family GTP cyclohydrolase 1 type 2